MKKLLSLLATTGLVATTSATVVACKSEVKKIELTKIIINKNLGELNQDGNTGKPSSETILNATFAKNKELIKSEVEVKNITNVKADIVVKTDSKKYIEKGSVEVNYIVKNDIKNKIDLSKIKGESLEISPLENSESSAKKAVIDQIKSKLSIDVVESTDISFENYKKPTLSEKGSIEVKSVKASTKVIGSATFILNYKEDRIDLSKIKGESLEISPLENSELSAKKAVIDQIKSKLSIDVVESTDISFENYKKPTLSEKGSIEVKSVKASTKVIGSATFILNYKEDRIDLSKIKGESLEISPLENSELSAKKAVIDQIKSKLSIDVVESTDISFENYKEPTSTEKGSIEVKSVKASTKVIGSATFILNYKETRKSIANISPKLDFNKSKIEIENIIKEEIIKIDKNVVLDKDYKISVKDKENKSKILSNTVKTAAGDVIEISAIETSKLIKDSKNVKIEQKNIEEVIDLKNKVFENKIFYVDSFSGDQAKVKKMIKDTFGLTEQDFKANYESKKDTNNEEYEIETIAGIGNYKGSISFEIRVKKGNI
ncbi:lipoprotein [Spiroplasma floricola]|uniref:Lipoprotein n=1 Tax=Spiroplasma floricola 23-6 TaxID=1336749 RepID=A0A2K8SE48_9MOLU|nr:lipoprotein [Spiroplasma floricola]AUB31693.1 hypothetical protein SFLOR_v1c06430 [Spiroplasma floricola 23-6]